jgi:hypothetical protein
MRWLQALGLVIASFLASGVLVAAIAPSRYSCILVDGQCVSVTSSVPLPVKAQ